MTESPCPNCGEPVDRRQLVCLNCGARVALQERPAWPREPVTVVAAVLIAVVVIGAGLFGFAISELTSDSGNGDVAPTQAADTTSAPKAAPDAPAVVSGGEQQPRTTAETPPEDAGGGVPRWPEGLSAHTVVLVSSSDRAAAMNVAKEARASGLEAGLIRSDPYDLGTGLWIVFSGQFTTPEGAARQARQLADRYPGAYPQQVQRSQ